MPDVNRYNIPVRATRAYVAGFGTSGSLLAGAAVLFLLGSAIVAFRGWPQIGTGPATSNVSAAPVAFASHPSRRLIQALARTHSRVSVRSVLTSSGGRHGTIRHRVLAAHALTGRPGGGAAPGSTSPGGGAVGASSGTSAPTGCVGCDSPGSGSSPNLITSLTNTVSQAVSKAGTDVGRQATGLGNTAAGPVSSTSPQAGSTLGNVGSTAGNAVSGTANTAGNAISAVGSAIGGGH